MSVTITNVGPYDGDPGGERNYEVRISGKLLAEFKHRRDDGLATCLRKAADAVEENRNRSAK